MSRGRGAAADAYDPDVYDTTQTITLTRDGLLQMDNGAPLPYDGWSGYTTGLAKMLESGLCSEFVEKELIPFHLDPARIPAQPVRDFYTDPVMNLFHRTQAVTGAQQVWMHPQFELASRLFDFRTGMLSLGNMFKEHHDAMNPDVQSVSRYRRFGATLDELKEVVLHTNKRSLEVALGPGGGGPDHYLARKIKATANFRVVAEALRAIGYMHYGGPPDPNEFIAIIDEAYSDRTADMLLMKRHAATGVYTKPFYVVAGAICGFLSVGIAAPPMPMSTCNDVPYVSMVQCVRYFQGSGPMGGGPIGSVETIYAIFYRAGNGDMENVSVPHCLCRGREYERLSGWNFAGDPQVGNVMWRTSIYYLADEFENDPRWHFAPPMAALEADAFVAQLPLENTVMNQERLRGIVLVLKPRASQEMSAWWHEHPGTATRVHHRNDMADVYQLDRARSTEHRLGELKHTLGSLRETHPLIFYTPKNADAGVYQMGKYIYTIEGPTRMPKAPLSLDTSRFSLSEERAATRIVPKVPTDREPWEYLKTDNVREVVYLTGIPDPRLGEPRHRLHRINVDPEEDAKNQALSGAAEALTARMQAACLASSAADEATAKAEAEAEAANKAAAEEARQAGRDADKDRRKAAKEKAATFETEKVPLTNEEKEDLARRANEAAKADRERLAEVEEERKARERKAREEAKKGKTKVSPQEAYKKAQDAKAIAKAQAAQSSRQANLRAADPNPARAQPEPVVAQVVRNMLEDQPRGGGGARGGKKGGKRGGR